MAGGRLPEACRAAAGERGKNRNQAREKETSVEGVTRCSCPQYKFAVVTCRPPSVTHGVVSQLLFGLVVWGCFHDAHVGANVLNESFKNIIFN